jgi:hypothetical protein
MSWAQSVALERIGVQPAAYRLAADADARAALAARFDLGSIRTLEAGLTLVKLDSGVQLSGRYVADFDYLCRVSRLPFAAMLEGPVEVRFLPEAELPAADDESLADLPYDLDVLEPGGIDIAEAVAATFSLALDPYPRGPEADAWLGKLGIRTEEQEIAARNPFAILAGEEKKG